MIQTQKIKVQLDAIMQLIIYTTIARGKEMTKICSVSDGGGVRAWNSRQCTAIALKINISAAYRRGEL